VPDPHDQLALVPHVVDELGWVHARVVRLAELLGGAVQRPSESVADRQQSRHQAGHQIFAGSGADDGVVGAGDGGAVVGRHHQTHLEELAHVGGEASLEPQQRDHPADTHVLLEDVRDGHAGVDQFLAALVANGSHEAGRFTDQAWKTTLTELE
jgi:hypothetical protein